MIMIMIKVLVKNWHCLGRHTLEWEPDKAGNLVYKLFECNTFARMLVGGSKSIEVSRQYLECLSDDNAISIMQGVYI